MAPSWLREPDALPIRASDPDGLEKRSADAGKIGSELAGIPQSAVVATTKVTPSLARISSTKAELPTSQP